MSTPAHLPIHGFMHVAMVNHWREIVNDQIAKMEASGLWERTESLTVGLLGGRPEDFPFKTTKVRILPFGDDFEQGELPTLATLQTFCQGHDALVFYMHTKGVFNRSVPTRDWRRYMEYFTILQHERCIAALQEYDVCGVHWHDCGWCRFYGGNFWWARADYVRTLPDIRSLRPKEGRDASNRHVCERWIGEQEDVRALNLHESGRDHYREPYPRSHYGVLHEVSPAPAFDCPSAWRGLENRFQDLLEPIGSIRMVVEVGVDFGFSLFTLAIAIPSAVVIGIDPYDHLTPSEQQRLRRLGLQGTIGSSEAEARVRGHLPSYPNVLLIKATSAEARRLLTGTIDVLHLDAVHAYDSLAEDFQLWEPLVRPGGCILFHDTRSFPDDVGRFFDELHGKKAELHDCNGLGAWYKSCGQRIAAPVSADGYNVRAL